MKRIWLLILILGFIPSVTQGADVQMTSGDSKVQAIRQFSATGTAAISASLAVPTRGTQVFELISVELHLSSAGGAADFTMTQNSGLGAVYDVVWLTQDMTTVTDLVIMYEPGEAMFSKLDTLDFAWTNTLARTYGLTVKYRLR